MTVQPLTLLTWNDKKRVRMLGGAAALGLSAVLTASLVGPSVPPVSGRMASVIVRESSGHEAEADRAIAAAGGHLKQHIGIIDAGVADVPAVQLAWLSRQAGVAGISDNANGHLASSDYSPTTSAGSMYSLARDLGVDRAWSAGITGNGVGVALIDSGVAPVNGLASTGKVINGPDLSMETSSPTLRYLDEYGHGTHLAGIIAGRDNAAGGDYARDSSNFIGIAPEARIVNVKVAGADGSTDVSQVLSAIDWVVQHRTDRGMNIRVLNLSFGTDSTQSYVYDPLAYAAEAAWNKGIVVVASVGNRGALGLTDPAIDPFIIAAGAAMPDPSGGLAYAVAPFSGVGTAGRTPDVVAPGKSIVSLRVPGSYVDQKFGATATVNDRFFRGTGTSQATAVTSGIVALLLQRYPQATPDQIKMLITSSATRVTGGTVLNAGSGLITLAGTALRQANLSTVVQAFTHSIGDGSLEEARGSLHVAHDGQSVAGELDVIGRQVDRWRPAQSEDWVWSGGDWNGSSWSGSSWSGSSWSGSSWSGSSWSGSSWSTNVWNGSSWSGSSWSGSSWSGSSWSGSSWSAVAWSSLGLTSDSWA